MKKDIRLTDEQKKLADQWFRLAIAFVKRMSLRPSRAGMVDKIGFDELVSLSFVALLEATTKWKPELGAKFNTYAWNAMETKFHNTARVVKRQPAANRLCDEFVSGNFPTPDIEAAKNERMEAVRAALKTLPEDNRFALECYYFRGWTDREIGEERGVTKQAANGWRLDGEQMLARRMARLEEAVA